MTAATLTSEESLTLKALKADGIIRSKEDEEGFTELCKSDWARREKSRWYLDPYNAEASFAFFTDFVCPPAWQGQLGPIHKAGSEFITNPQFQNDLILWPREHLKTTQFLGEEVRLRIANPEGRTLLGHEKHKSSMEYLIGIKGILSKPAFIAAFGSLLPDKTDRRRRDNQESLDLSSRKDLSIREACFSTGGVDKSVQGGHFDRIYMDDLVTEENAPADAKPEQLERPIKFWRTLPDLADKQIGRIRLVGTWHHPQDLYGMLMEEMCDPECRALNDRPWANWRHQEHCACEYNVSKWELCDEDGNYAYPARFNPKLHASLLRTKGTYSFAKHYLNNPSDQSMCWIKEADLSKAKIQRSEYEQLRSEGKLILLQICDPAESKKKGSAYTGIVTVGVHKETGDWIIAGATQKRVDPREFMSLVLAEHRRFSPDIFGIELNTRKAMKFVIETGMALENYYFGIEELNPKFSEADEKRRRFKQNVVPMFTYGKVKIVDDSDMRDLFRFLAACPQTRYWDLGDCLSYVPDLAPVINQITGKNQPKRHRVIVNSVTGY